MCFFPLNTQTLCYCLDGHIDLSQGLRSSFTLSVCFETGSHGSWTGNWGQPWILDPSSLECWDYRVRIRVYMVLGIKPRAPSMLDNVLYQASHILSPSFLVFKIIHWLQVTSHLFVVSLGTWGVSVFGKFVVCSLSHLCCCSFSFGLFVRFVLL